MYKIVGADRREYGPVTADQIREWIAQGRANSQTLARFEEGAWKPLGTFPEFAASFGQSIPPLAGSAPPPIGQPLAPPQTIIVPTPAPTSNSMAVAGLVCGILGLFCCPIIGATLAIIFSAIGLNQIRQTPERYTTDRIVPILGMVLGVIGFILMPMKAWWFVSHTPFKNFPKF